MLVLSMISCLVLSMLDISMRKGFFHRSGPSNLRMNLGIITSFNRGKFGEFADSDDILYAGETENNKIHGNGFLLTIKGNDPTDLTSRLLSGWETLSHR